MTKDKLIELAQVGMGIHSPNAPEYIVCEALIKALAQPEPEYLSFMDTPQRIWVGLTDEEIQYCVELKNPEAIAEEVEAKLKEKNT